jgi:hypothetical protein
MMNSTKLCPHVIDEQCIALRFIKTFTQGYIQMLGARDNELTITREVH